MNKAVVYTIAIMVLIGGNISQAGYIYLIESGKVVKQCAFVDPMDTLIKGGR